MKSLFRTIRRKLLDEGKLLRYLTYALGEILLIVVGILLALKISDWNEDQKAQVEFDLYVVQLREDVQLAIENVEGSVKLNERFRSEAEFVLTFLEFAEYGKDDLVSFETGLSSLGLANQPYVHIGLLGELLNGKTEIIARNPTLNANAQNMVSRVGRRLGNIEQIQDTLRRSKDRLTKFRSRGIAREDRPPKYNLKNLQSSQEFVYAADMIISELESLTTFSEVILEALETFLTTLEEYDK